MTEKELDLYAKWESERMRLMNMAEAASLKKRSAAAAKYEARAKERYKCMRELSRLHSA